MRNNGHTASNSGRIIGIRHRVKATKDGEARPTQVAIFEKGKLVQTYELASEQDELDFVHCQFPVRFRDVKESDSLLEFRPWHLKTRKLRPIDDEHSLPTLKVGTETFVVTKVPVWFDGMKSGDQIAMIMGGSGDNLAYAMAQRSKKKNLGVTVFRVTGHRLKDFRQDDKENDAAHIARFFIESADRFYPVTPRDQTIIRVRELYRLREETMKARIACGQRIDQLSIGQIFCSEDGEYPQGKIEKEADRIRTSDPTYAALLMQEKHLNKQLEGALESVPVYTDLLSRIEGVGPAVAGRIISIVQDARLFKVDPDADEMARLYDLSQNLERLYFDPVKDKLQLASGAQLFDRLQAAIEHYRRTGSNATAMNGLRESMGYHTQRSKLKQKAIQKSASKFKAFLGVHLTKDEGGEWVFPRRRKGVRCNWNPNGRQAMYLLGDQFNRRPASDWGIKLRHYKELQRELHPEETTAEGKKRFTPAHIHKRAVWRTLTRFAEAIYIQWLALDESVSA